MKRHLLSVCGFVVLMMQCGEANEDPAAAKTFYAAEVVSIVPKPSRKALFARKRWAVTLKECTGDRTIVIRIGSPVRFFGKTAEQAEGEKILFSVEGKWSADYWGKASCVEWNGKLKAVKWPATQIDKKEVERR